MSFEIFLHCFDGGEPAGMARAAIRALFPIVETQSEADRWTVRYDDLNSCEIHVGPLPSDASLVTAMTVRRPCADLRLWEALLAIMRLGQTTLYFPGDSPPLVANAEAGGHLPPEMVETLGQPHVVMTAQDILDAIDAA